MKILAFDSATEVLSVSVLIEGVGNAQPQSLSCMRDVGLRHTGMLLPLIQSLLDESGLTVGDLDLVVCTRGPGSFTGLRIGMSTAKGIAEAISELRNLKEPPLVAVSTLDAMAAGCVCPMSITIPVIDGRKGRFYSAAYTQSRRLTEDLDADSILVVERAVSEVDRQTSITVTGPHAPLFLTRLRDADLVTSDPTPKVMGNGSHEISLVIDPRHRSGWSMQAALLGVELFQANGALPRDAGPDYVRASDAELSR